MTEWWLSELVVAPTARAQDVAGGAGTRGMGRDPEVEKLLDDIEERACADLVAYLSAQYPGQAAAELSAVLVPW